jgi:hypothetical protein
MDLERIYTGHFRALDGGTAVIDEYLAHRAERRRSVIEALGVPRTVDEIVKLVYADTPEHLHALARLQVVAMLELLEEEEIVEVVDENWRRLDFEGKT